MKLDERARWARTTSSVPSSSGRKSAVDLDWIGCHSKIEQKEKYEEVDGRFARKVPRHRTSEADEVAAERTPPRDSEFFRRRRRHRAVGGVVDRRRRLHRQRRRQRHQRHQRHQQQPTAGHGDDQRFCDGGNPFFFLLFFLLGTMLFDFSKRSDLRPSATMGHRKKRRLLIGPLKDQ